MQNPIQYTRRMPVRQFLSRFINFEPQTVTTVAQSYLQLFLVSLVVLLSALDTARVVAWKLAKFGLFLFGLYNALLWAFVNLGY